MKGWGVAGGEEQILGEGNFAPLEDVDSGGKCYNGVMAILALPAGTVMVGVVTRGKEGCEVE